MIIKSFKDNLAEMNVVQPTTADETPPVTITPTVPDINPIEVKEIKVEIPVQPIRIELTEEIADVLTEQREQSAKVLESVMKTNTKIANSITKLVKSSAATNDKLVEAIIALTEKIGMLETKLDAIEHLEIPTPIVHIQMPNKAVNKEIHRDDKGIITHITESEVVDDKDE